VFSAVRLGWWRSWRAPVSAAVLSATSCWRKTKNTLRHGGSRGQELRWRICAIITEDFILKTEVYCVPSRLVHCWVSKPFWALFIWPVCTTAVLWCYSCCVKYRSTALWKTKQQHHRVLDYGDQLSYVLWDRLEIRNLHFN